MNAPGAVRRALEKSGPGSQPRPQVVPAVQTRSLTRDYTSRGGWGRRGQVRRALDEVSLTIADGEVHGLLGPNGAGKTTLVKVLATILVPTSGEAEVFGRDVRADAPAVRRLVGLVLGGDRGHYFGLTARENLNYWAAMYGVPARALRSRVDGLLDRVGLGARAEAKVETFSRGMKQRLHLARGLIGDPRLLVLDEPTSGMDPVAAVAFRDMVRELSAEGRTILMTTHDMGEAESLCHRVTLINEGRLLATESPDRLAGRLSGVEYVDVDDLPQQLTDELDGHAAVQRIAPGDRGATRIVTVSGDGTATVVAALLRAEVVGFRVSRPTLAESYVEIVGDRGMEV